MSDSQSKYAYLAKPDEEWVAAAAKLPPRDPAMDQMSLPEQRVIIGGMMKALRAANPLVLDPTKIYVTEVKIPVGEGVEIRAAHYRPVPQAEKGETEETLFPLLVYYHGGGFALMDIEMEERRLTDLAVGARVSVLNVDYRLAPENPFPVGLNDSYEALKWSIANAALLKADPAKGLVIGGASSGGNFAASLALIARDDPAFPSKITGQLLQIPVVVAPVAREKYAAEIHSPEELALQASLSKATITKLYENYVPSSVDPADPRISPLLATSHAGLPPALIQICGLDPLRDEGFVYERVLKEAGVPTKVVIYPGVPHGFHAVFPDHSLAKKWNADVEEGMKWFASLL